MREAPFAGRRRPRAPPGAGVVPYCLNERTSCTRPLMSSSESLSAKDFIFSLPDGSLRPSLICLAACSSVNSAWYLASVMLLTWAILPALVCPAPSGPWQDAQFLVQLSLASAASRGGAPARRAAAANAGMTSFFMVLRFRVLGWKRTGTHAPSGAAPVQPKACAGL